MADEKEIYYDNEIDHVVIVSGKYVDKIKLDTEPKYSNYTKIEEELTQKVSALYGSPISPSKSGGKHIALKTENGDELYVLEWHFEKQNIVKRVCKELGITQRELAERIGMSADSLRTLSAKGQISMQTEAAINLVLENENLKRELENYKALRTAIKTMID
ncbi:helix-turn-helix domain-containing protein [Campylobacter concisus]|uniref:helix-turn-helix domain-containing protein n=1 Tax=Campylobacter concisus TaxID=199 RepID=UPI0021562C26|nr:helix-turn-helix transcriptional regulator [Campylobacter concisus]